MMKFAAASGGPVRVRPVETRQEWAGFHALPAAIQGGDPNWIRPLLREQRRLWSAANRWFEHGRAQAWLAWRGDRPVGRISAQVDEYHFTGQDSDTGMFGQLEAVDDPEVFAALLDAAASWIAGQGRRGLLGPFDLSINQSCGLLVDGFGVPPMMMMGHAPPYYHRRLEELGLKPATDLLAYRLSPRFKTPPAMERIVERAGERIELQAIGRGELAGIAPLLQEIFNDAWSENWGFVPFSRSEFEHMASEMKLLIRPGYVHLAHLDGEPAAFMVTLPNLNELIADLDGRLFPTGGLRLLWRLARNRHSTVRIPLMGVRKRFQGGILGAALTYRLVHATRPALLRDGVRFAELSWILENNRGMRSLIESLGADAYKRYRIYRWETA